jgi:hypothetical protein
MKMFYEFTNYNLPQTININGVDKPTTNSNGDFIHSTKEGIINFWNWFGESKVVNNFGQPIVMYHGTQNDFDVFNTDNELGAHFGNVKQANHITSNKIGDAHYRYYQNVLAGQSIIPTYLSIKNPLRLKDIGEFSPKKVVKELINMNIIGDELDTYLSNKDIVTIISSKGYDGVVYLNKHEGLIGGFRRTPSGDSYIAFFPNQIKAKNNSGNFDINKTSILENKNKI